MAGPVRIAILANGSQARAEMNKTANAGQAMGDKFAKFRAPAALALAGIAVGAKTAVSAASDLNETMSKSRIVFGKHAADVEKWAKSADKNLGLSKNAALSAAAQFGDLFGQLGATQAEAARTGKGIVELATDLGSFNNLESAEVLDKIAGAMRGEYDAIQKIIPGISDKRVKEEALNRTGKKSVAALTEQEKAMAALAIIQKDSARAQGDFARTSDGVANKSKIAATRAENLRAKLGQGLLPAYSALLSIGTKFLAFLARHETAVKVTVAAVAALATVVLVASAGQAVYNASMIVFNATMAVYRGVMVAARTAQLAFNIAVALNPIGVIVAGVILLAGALFLAYKRSDKFRAIVNAAFGAVVSAGKAAFNFVKSKWPILLAILTGPFGLAVLAIAKNWSKIKDGATAVKKWISEKFQALVGVLQIVGSKIKSALLAPFEAIRNAVQKVIDLISKIKIPKLPDLNPFGRVSVGRTSNLTGFDSGTTASSALQLLVDQSTTLNRAGDVIQVSLEVPVGASGADIGRELVGYLSDYYAVGGKRP